MADLCTLPPQLAKLAEDELGETPDKRREALKELRSRIAQLPQAERLADTTDENLVRFLRSRKYDINEALNSTIKLQKFNTEHPEWTEGLSAAEFAEFKEFFQVLQSRGPKGEYVFCLRPTNGIKIFTPEHMKEKPLAMIRSNIWMLDALSRNPQVQVAGLIVCCSYKGFTFKDNLTLSKAAKVSEQMATFKYVSIMGFRLTGAFMLDQPAYMTWLWAVIRLFVSDVIRARFHLCGSDYDKVKAVLPDTSILPVCMGGKVEDGGFSWVEEQVANEAKRQQAAARSV